MAKSDKPAKNNPPEQPKQDSQPGNPASAPKDPKDPKEKKKELEMIFEENHLKQEEEKKLLKAKLGELRQKRLKELTPKKLLRQPGKKGKKAIGVNLKSFHRKGEFLKCRFCGYDIAEKRRDGSLFPNKFYQRAEAILTNGTVYRFNGCKECMAQLDPVMVECAFQEDSAVPSALRKEQVVDFGLIETKINDVLGVR